MDKARSQQFPLVVGICQKYNGSTATSDDESGASLSSLDGSSGASALAAFSSDEADPRGTGNADESFESVGKSPEENGKFWQASAFVPVTSAAQEWKERGGLVTSVSGVTPCLSRFSSCCDEDKLHHEPDTTSDYDDDFDEDEEDEEEGTVELFEEEASPNVSCDVWFDVRPKCEDDACEAQDGMPLVNGVQLTLPVGSRQRASISHSSAPDPCSPCSPTSDCFDSDADVRAQHFKMYCDSEAESSVEGESEPDHFQLSSDCEDEEDVPQQDTAHEWFGSPGSPFSPNVAETRTVFPPSIGSGTPRWRLVNGRRCFKRGGPIP